MCAQGKGRALLVLNFQVYQAMCFCFTSIIVILRGSLQIRKLRLREVKVREGHPSRSGDPPLPLDHRPVAPVRSVAVLD